MNRLRSLFPLAAIVVALWPVLNWWVERTADSSDDALGLVALVVLVMTTLADRRRERMPAAGWVEVALLGAYAVSFPFVPNLVRAGFAAAIIGTLISRQRGTGAMHFGTWGLVAMTLPLLASLRFFLGYPLRWLATNCTAFLLRLGGVGVEVDGLALVLGPVEVWVDGPCSGVQMLWVGVFLAAALAFVFRLRNAATLGLFAVSLIATVAGNIWRASGVFYMESGLVDVPDAFHELIGMAAFAVVAAGVASGAFALRRYSVDVAPTPESTRALRMLPIVCAFAAIVPFVTPPSDATEAVHAFPGWPTQLDGATLHPRELSERDKPYLAGFPGKIAAFQTHDEDVLIRWVTAETRRLHSAADCYRGLGYEVEPLQPLYPGYTTFRVQKDGRSLVVSERIEDETGESWGEVGGWYWAAKLGQTEGPWWSVVRTGAGH